MHATRPHTYITVMHTKMSMVSEQFIHLHYECIKPAVVACLPSMEKNQIEQTQEECIMFSGAQV